MAEKTRKCDLDTIKWSGKLEKGDTTISEKGQCLWCGKVFEWVWLAEGIFDPETEDYVRRV